MFEQNGFYSVKCWWVQQTKDLSMADHEIPKQSLFSFILSALKISIIAGIILAVSDWFLGLFNSNMTYRVYFSFLAAYFVLSLIIGTLSAFATKWMLKKEKNTVAFYRFFFVLLLYVYVFIYANLKLTGWINPFNLRSAVINIALIVSSILLYIFSKRIRTGSLFTNTAQTGVTMLYVFPALALYNYFFLHYQSPPDSKTAVLISLFWLLFIPYLMIGIRIALWLLLSKPVASDKIRTAVVLICALVLFLSGPFVFRFPDMSSAKIMKYKSGDRLGDRTNVILIVTDTARRDNFSCYGHHHNTTPNIDAFAKDGVLFSNFIATGSWTLPTHASLFTGMYPSRHGAHHSDNHEEGIPLADGNVTLAEILAEQGYHNAAVVSNYAILGKQSNIQQGFHYYLVQASQFQNFFWGLVTKEVGLLHKIIQNRFFKLNFYKLSSEINTYALNWLNHHRDEDFFLFINYMEPHKGANYLPEGYDRLYGFNWKRWDRETVSQKEMEKIIHLQQKVPVEHLQVEYDWMDCKVHYMDKYIGKLMSSLKAMNLYDSSLIILMSDHGELFGEHNSFSHTEDLYNELIRVPLIIKYPKTMNRKGNASKYVQTVDLMPEILSLLNVPVPEDLQGQPIGLVNHKIISELFRSKLHPITKLFPERYYRDLKSIISSKHYKYIQASNDMDELFNLATDSLELFNIISDMPSKAARLDRQIEEWTQSFEPASRDDSKQQKMDKNLKRKLKALGYIQ